MDRFIEVEAPVIEYNLAYLRQLIFEVTDACNLSCKYCAYSELYGGYDNRENKKFPIHRAKLVIDYLYNLWKKNKPNDCAYPITITFYGGEPTLNMPFVRDVIAYLNTLPDAGRMFNYGMTTNAMLLDKYMDFLVENNFFLLISLDGDKEAQSYRIDKHGRNSFDTVYRNVKLLQNKYPEYFKSNVSFNSVVHNRNDVDTSYHFIKDNFEKETGFSPLSLMGVNKDKQKEFNEIYRSVYSSIKESHNCNQLEKELFSNNPQTYSIIGYIRYNSGNIYNNYTELFVDHNKMPKLPTGTCVPFSKKMFVTVNGRILQCEKINHAYSLGTVDDEKVNLDFERIARQHNEYIYTFIKQCEICAIKQYCNNCIFEANNLNESDAKCQYYITPKGLQNHRARQLEYLAQHPELYRRTLKEIIIK